jgi:hypothetical protein
VTQDWTTGETPRAVASDASRLYEERFFRRGVFLDPAFLELRDVRAACRGTLAPSRLAWDRPMATACLSLVTFLPERPECNAPRFFSLIARSTSFEAFGPYFLPLVLFVLGMTFFLSVLRPFAGTRA